MAVEKTKILLLFRNAILIENKGFREIENRRLEKYTRERHKLFGELVLGSREKETVRGHRGRNDTNVPDLHDGEKFENGNRSEKRTNVNVVSTGDPGDRVYDKRAYVRRTTERIIIILFIFLLLVGVP